jgi:hypothetical protein
MPATSIKANQTASGRSVEESPGDLQRALEIDLMSSRKGRKRDEDLQSPLQRNSDDLPSNLPFDQLSAGEPALQAEEDKEARRPFKPRGAGSSPAGGI